MSNITVKFLGKDYSIPEDVLTYIDLLDFTDNVHKYLASTFVRKLRNEIAKDNIGLLGDEDLAAEIEQQVGKYIAKLCDNGIFTRTISDYLKNNKGYQLYSDVNKAALEKMKSLLIQEMDAWQAGYENAVNKAESHVTGMGFSIWSSSFVNHAIYAAMEASTLNKQGKEAEAQYQKDMNDLRSRLDSQYGGEKSNYINNTYIPNMEAALTVFAYELLDKYVADLIASGKFDSKTLDYVDIGRSNDLLKNLTLSNNKQAILENAFAACPYNIAVYMQAMKYDLLDYDSFQTAKVFKQDHHILSFFRESWGEVSFPTKFNINYHCINVWASLTGKTTADLLRGLTEQYATGIVKAYSRVADIMADQSACRKIIGELREDAILSGASICVGKAREYVEPIVNTSTWEQLTEKCGHTDLLSRIKKCFPSVEELQSKKDFDRSVTEQLAARFEEVRKELAEQIAINRRQEEKQRALEAEQREKEIARRKKTLRNFGKVAILAGVILAIAMLVVHFVSLHREKEREYEEYITWYNIDFASSFLGETLNDDGSISMGDGDYEAITNDMYLFGIPGRFTHGTTADGSASSTVDMLDWVSTESVINIEDVLNPLIEKYGDNYRLQYYDDASCDAYMWKNVDKYEYVICWQGNGRIAIRWIVWVPSISNQSFDVHGLTCYVPGTWEIYQSDDYRVGKGEHKEDGEYKGSWYIKYMGQYQTVLDCIDERWSSSFPSDFRENYVKTEIKDCDEAYIYDEVDEDGKWRSVDFFVLCDGSVFRLQYFKYTDFFNEAELTNLLSLVDFDTYNYTEPETFEEMCGLLKGTFIPENEDVKNLKMHSPENDDYNLKIDENGVLHNVPYLDYDTEKVKLGTGTITDVDTTYSKYGTYVYSVAIDGSAEAIVKLTYDYNANTLGLETKKDLHLLFYVDYYTKE